MRNVLAFIALVLLASTAHGASPSPGANSLVIVACKVTDWTGKRPLPELWVDVPHYFRDLELYINDNQEYECKREVLKDLEDATAYSEEATADHVPVIPNFSNPPQCAKGGIAEAAKWNDKNIGNIEDDRIDNDGYAVVGVGCPVPWMNDNGTPNDKSDDFPTGSYKMPECPTNLPGTDNRMKCRFDESNV